MAGGDAERFRRVRIEDDAPPGLRGLLFPSLAAMLEELQCRFDAGDLPADRPFIVTVALGTGRQHRRWVCVGERGAVRVTGPGGERRGEVSASQSAGRRHAS